MSYSTVPSSSTGLKPSDPLEVETTAPPSKFKRYGRDAAIALALLLSASAAYVSLSKPSSSNNLRAGATVKSPAVTDLHSASCPDPYHWTKCVKSKWGTSGSAYESDEHDFQKACKGNLIHFDSNDYVKDCGKACVGCSYIKACCDTCESIYTVDQSWEMFHCTDLQADMSHSWGIRTDTSTHWERTDDWSRGVSLKASATGIIEGVKITGDGSAEQKRAIQTKEEESWFQETTSNTQASYTQPADTCTWRWKTVITDSCGTKVAFDKSIQTTWGPNSKDPTGAAHPESADGVARANKPCCMPNYDPIYLGNGKFTCPKNDDGLVVTLC